MSTPLVILASILAFFAVVLIPLMMFKGDRPQNQAQQGQVKPGGKSHKKRKKR